MTIAIQPLSESEFVLCAILVLMVPLAIAGLVMLNVGLGRARSAAHSVLGALCILAVAAITYVVFGFGIEGAPGLPEHAATIAGKPWNWIAVSPWFLRSISSASASTTLAVLLQLFGISLAAQIPWGSGSDRWKLRAACISTVLFAGFLYPLFANWVWSGGWLAQLGANYGLGRGFIDPAGASTMQALGGLTALAIIWIVGPRSGKFVRGEMPAVYPAHHILYVLIGCFIMLGGWIGLNGAGALLFAGIPAERIPLVAINTVLCASGSLLTAFFVTRFRFGKPDASLSANGWVAGLSASSAICSSVTPAGAVLIGLMLGGAISFIAEALELHCGLDDPSGGISMHAVGGIWGLLVVGFMGHLGVPRSGQMLAQLTGILTLVGFALPCAYVLNLLLSKLVPYRATSEGDYHGMDVYELGAGAYPEFYMQNDDIPR